MSFLEEQCGKTDRLILLGDIFEFWIGKNTVVAEHIPLIDILERMVRQGTQLVYVEGNHDFHLGPIFTDRLSCKVLPDGGSIELDGKKIFIAHGDLANPNDTGYHKLRKLLRSRFIRHLIRILPSKLTMMIATRAGYESRKKSGEVRKHGSAKEILKTYAQPAFRSGHEAVVTGHFHQPFHEKSDDGELIALGDWITQYSYAVYENQTFTLKNYSTTPTPTVSTS